MEFIETEIFTKMITELIDDESYRKFQNTLLENPEAGKLIPQGGGIRKIRWKLPHKGKSGGIRVIYYYKKVKSQIFMLIVYPKNAADTLSDTQVNTLAKFVKEI